MCGRAGEEVTISYGAFPNDVFLLFFGFVPAANPHDAVPLFADLGDLVAAAAAGLPAAARGALSGSAGAVAGATTQHGGPPANERSEGSAAPGAEASSERTTATAAVPEPARSDPEQVSGASCSSAEQELSRRLPRGDYSRHATLSPRQRAAL